MRRRTDLAVLPDRTERHAAAKTGQVRPLRCPPSLSPWDRPVRTPIGRPCYSPRGHGRGSMTQTIGRNHGIEGPALVLRYGIDDRCLPGHGGEPGVAVPSLVLRQSIQIARRTTTDPDQDLTEVRTGRPGWGGGGGIFGCRPVARGRHRAWRYSGGLHRRGRSRHGSPPEGCRGSEQLHLDRRTIRRDPRPAVGSADPKGDQGKIKGRGNECRSHPPDRLVDQRSQDAAPSARDRAGTRHEPPPTGPC